MAFEQGQALVIGISRYQHAPDADVPVALEDARAVAQILQDPDICGYPPGQVRLLADEAATKAGILEALDELAANTGEADTVFLFYCGHGALGTDGEYYLVSHDARGTASRVQAGTGVSEAELLAKLKALPAKRTFLVFNACYSGNISPSLDFEEPALAVRSLSTDTSAALLGSGEGRIILTACRENQKSYFKRSGGLSYFTQALTASLRGRGVHNNGGFISAFSLYEALYEQVRQQSQSLELEQEPELTVIKGVGPFAVALYKGASDLGSFAPEEAPPDLPAVQQVPLAYAMKLSIRQVDTGGGAYIEGSVHTGGGDFIGRDRNVIASGGGIAIGGNVSGSNIVSGHNNIVGSQVSQQAFYLNEVLRRIDARPGSSLEDKAGLKAEVLDLQKEDARGPQADETTLTRRLRSIQRMAPDILDMLLAVIANPAAGFGLVAQMAAQKMQVDAGG
jgi:hypothetical protein